MNMKYKRKILSIIVGIMLSLSLVLPCSALISERYDLNSDGEVTKAEKNIFEYLQSIKTHTMIVDNEVEYLQSQLDSLNFTLMIVVIAFAVLIITILVLNITTLIKYNKFKNLIVSKKSSSISNTNNKFDIYEEILKCCELSHKRFMNKISESPVADFYDYEFTSKELVILLYSLVKYQFAPSDIPNLAQKFEEQYNIDINELNTESIFYDALLSGEEFRPGYACLSSSGLAKTPVSKCLTAFCDIIVNPASKNYDIYDIACSLNSPPIDMIAYMLFYLEILEPTFTILLSVMNEMKKETK